MRLPERPSLLHAFLHDLLHGVGGAEDYREELRRFHTFQSFGGRAPRAGAAVCAAGSGAAERSGSAPTARGQAQRE